MLTVGGPDPELSSELTKAWFAVVVIVVLLPSIESSSGHFLDGVGRVVELLEDSDDPDITSTLGCGAPQRQAILSIQSLTMGM